MYRSIWTARSLWLAGRGNDFSKLYGAVHVRICRELMYLSPDRFQLYGLGHSLYRWELHSVSAFTYCNIRIFRDMQQFDRKPHGRPWPMYRGLWIARSLWLTGRGNYLSKLYRIMFIWICRGFLCLFSYWFHLYGLGHSFYRRKIHSMLAFFNSYIRIFRDMRSQPWSMRRKPCKCARIISRRRTGFGS